MNKTDAIYLALPNNSTLYLYKRLGLLEINHEKIKLHKDITNVIQLCLKGLSLYDATQLYCANANNNEKILLGIMSLIAEKKLLLRQKENEICNVKIVNEEDAFYPQSIHIELTRTCNLNCYYCYKDSGPNVNENEIPVETLLDIVQKLSERGLTVAELTGGEPLLHPNFLKILEFCCNHLSLVSILTNGTLVNEDFVKKVIPFKNKIVFSISLDSYLEVEHDRKSRIQGSFQKTVNAIKLISKENIIVRVSMAVDDTNWNQIEDTLLFAKSLGATKFTYSPIIPVGRANIKNKQLFGAKIPVAEVIDYEKYLMDNYSDFLHVLDGYSQRELNNPGGCGVGSRAFVMNPQGIVRMCASFENGIIGDTTKEPLKEIFSNRLCALSAQVTPPTVESCNKCQYFSFCMGCSLRAMRWIEEIGIDNCYWLSNNKIAKEWFLNIR